MFSTETLSQAQNGNLEAMLDIANSYYKGANTSIDGEKAFYWYSKAFELAPDNTKAINGLADCYREGKGVKKDFSRCMELYQKSESRNDPYGITMIGHSYFDGISNEVNFDEAIEYYQKASRLNSLEAIDSLYDAYCEKYDENIANIKYIDFLRILANEENPLAMVRLFDTYTEDEIAPKDENTALYYLNRSVDMNCPRAITTLAMACFRGDILNLGKDEQKARELIENAAKLNDEWALNFLAHSYNYGTDGYPQDVIKAKEYYERCIEIGELFYSDSLCELGLELCDSRNEFFDLERGINLLTEVAEHDEAVSANYLGHIYEDGFMLPQNINKAIKYYKIAAEQDHPKAQYNLGRLLIDGLFGAPKDETLAISLFERAAQQGNFSAMEDLGICAYQGKGMPVDKERARMLFENCAKEGLPQSQYDFALMNYQGEGGPANYKAAEYWYNKTIEQNIDVLTKNAKCDLAFMYSQNTKEYNKAFPLWEEFAKNGDPSAQYNVGLFYSNGWGVPYDAQKAKYWIEQSANQGNEEAIKALDIFKENGYTYDEDIVPVHDSSEETIPADISIFKKITIFSTVFFIIGFIAAIALSQNFLIALLAGYLISVLPLSIMRLKGLKMSGGQAVMTAAAGYLAHQNKENGCAFALSFILGRWLMNYVISVIISPYWYIKSIVILIKSISN